MSEDELGCVVARARLFREAYPTGEYVRVRVAR